MQNSNRRWQTSWKVKITIFQALAPLVSKENCYLKVVLLLFWSPPPKVWYIYLNNTPTSSSLWDTGIHNSAAFTRKTTPTAWRETLHAGRIVLLQPGGQLNSSRNTGTEHRLQQRPVWQLSISKQRCITTAEKTIMTGKIQFLIALYSVCVLLLAGCCDC